MKITSIECFSRKMVLRESYTIAYETVNVSENIFLRIRTDTDLEGWGCAAPDKAVTGETAETVLAMVRDIAEPILQGHDPWRYVLINHELSRNAPKSPSARAMVDMALFDIISRQANVPLYKFLGGFRSHIATCITIGIMPVEQAVTVAEKYTSMGFKRLKIKGGRSLDEDIERIVKIRERIGSQSELRFDANQGYTLEESLEFIRRTSKARIELFEQPTDKNNEELMRELVRQVPVPVMADESLMTIKDVFRLTSRQCTDMINIKLMKVGGITDAMHINSVAKAAGVEAMVGCMDESALGIAAGLHFALSRPNIFYADLDGHLGLEKDPFAQMLPLRNGILYPGKFPGLGYRSAPKL